jgi:threonine synthase
MKFMSTKGGSTTASLSSAVRLGAARDGGLYLPQRLDWLDASALAEGKSLAAFASAFLHPFFAGDQLEADLPSICAEAFDFAVPLVRPDPSESNLLALELFHGPTGAFKDFGARFLMGCFDRIADPARPLTVLAATSGDTGGAVGCAGEGRLAVQTIILFPRGRVSAFQERQLTCWGDRVHALEVDGDFDDCQRLAKAAFSDADLVRMHRLTSANSINIGRLLPQAAYITRAALQASHQGGETPGFIVPTGNLGHGFAALLARTMGAPIGPVILATNANPTLKEWAETGCFEARQSIATLANAMDVGNPGNFERLIALPEEMRKVRVELVDDDAIKTRIAIDFKKFGYAWCPHSATAAEAFSRLSDKERTERPWILAATAHPFKFRETVEPLIERDIKPTPGLEAVFDRSTSKERIEANFEALSHALEAMNLAAVRFTS